jgi:hypothetical protein
MLSVTQPCDTLAPHAFHENNTFGSVQPPGQSDSAPAGEVLNGTISVTVGCDLTLVVVQLDERPGAFTFTSGEDGDPGSPLRSSRRFATPVGYKSLVGEAGFEPATPWPPARCASGLRYSPTEQ